MPHFSGYKFLNFCLSLVSLQSRTKGPRVCVYANKMNKGFIVVSLLKYPKSLMITILIPVPHDSEPSAENFKRTETYVAWHRRGKTL